MNNTRFATALHIVTLLASYPEEWVSSELIAGSINVNPVVVRKEIGVLKKAGLVICKMGKEGGYRLGRSVSEIKISDIYHIVHTSEVLGRKNRSPNPKCNVGRKINQRLDLLFKETDQLVMAFLGQKSLKEFTEQFR